MSHPQPSDSKITIQQLENIMNIANLQAQHRKDYIKELMSKSVIIEAILSVSTIGLPNNTDNLLTYSSKAKTLNVSRLLELLLHSASDITSPNEELLLGVLSSCKLIGIHPKTLTDWFPNMMHPSVAITYLLGDRDLPLATTALLICGCCNRAMKSVNSQEGICTNCKHVLDSFAEYRCEAFEVPLNHLNIPRYRTGSGELVVYKNNTTGWSFTSKDGLVMAELTSPSASRQLDIPFVEYQKDIIL